MTGNKRSSYNSAILHNCDLHFLNLNDSVLMWCLMHTELDVNPWTWHSHSVNLNQSDLKLHSKVLHRKVSFYFFGCTTKKLGSHFSNQGSNSGPWKWKIGVLTTGLPGSSPHGKVSFYVQLLKNGNPSHLLLRENLVLFEWWWFFAKQHVGRIWVCQAWMSASLLVSFLYFLWCVLSVCLTTVLWGPH